MSGLTENENGAIDTANAADSRPVLFIHGPGAAPDDWEGWRALFEANGFATIVADWSTDPTLVDTARTEPDTLGATVLQQTTEHYLELIGRLTIPPVVIGHGFGGLIAQRVASEGVSATTIAIASWPISGVPASTLGDTESDFFRIEGIAIDDPATVDPRRAGRGPLLLLAGGDDAVIPSAVSDAVYALQSENPDVTEYTVFPGLDHGLVSAQGWREVADTAVVFARNYAAPKQH